MRTHTVALLGALVLCLSAATATATAQQAVKPYIHVIVDTSPSMANSAGCSGCGTRMQEVVFALQDIFSGVGEVTFGLQSFLDLSTCGPLCLGCANAGCGVGAGDVLVPFSNGNQAELYDWVDLECSAADTSNLELLAYGGLVAQTPIAANLAGAVSYMSSVIGADAKNVCRPYVVVFLTDGEENCGATDCSGSVTQRNALCNIGVSGRPTGCTVPTYMIGLPGANLMCLDSIQDLASTGRDTAIQATNRADLALAFQDIVADSVLIEVCDELEDEDCDGLVDEGFQLYCDLPNSITDNVLCNDPGDPCDGVDDNCFAGIADEVRNACGTCGPAPEEVCDELDNDCDGFIDEALNCDATCTPTGAEVCNTLDDDCDGLVDEADPLAGTECGSDEGTCTPGRLRCINGELQCVGGNPPRPEVCDGLDNDCNMEIDDDAECPPNTACIDAACRPPCDPEEEFPCPVGLSCEKHTDGDFYCVPSACDDCGPGERCLDRGCVDLCTEVQCDSDQSCLAGKCVGCSRGGCGDGEICVEESCQADPCADVECEDGEACRDGACAAPCRDRDCQGGLLCQQDWSCAEDACADTECLEGKACLAGECIEDACISAVCSSADVCVIGEGCIPDPCLRVRCPAGSCKTSAMGVPVCRADGGSSSDDDDGDADDDADDEVDARRLIASGGGGCTCRTAGEADGSGWPLLLAMWLLGRRRRPGQPRPASPARRPSPLSRALPLSFVLPSLLLLVLAASGCKVDTFCLDCQNDGADGADGDAGRPPGNGLGMDSGADDDGRANPPDAGTDDGPLVCMRGAEELCNDFDDDCDRIVDEGFDLDADPRHCGECGSACAPPNADGICDAARCKLGTCFDGFADLADDEPGCEYRCPVFPIQGEACNGLDDDCDGLADEADDLPAPPTDLCKDTAGTPCAGTLPICTARGGVTGWYCDYADEVEFDPAVPNGIATDETLCDGHDGDCDGVADDTFVGLGTPCSTGTGECLTTGERVCNGAGDGVECSAAAPPAGGDESCNGKDDDCDGDVDEDLGTMDMVRVTRAALDFWIDVHEASRPVPGSDRACGDAARDPWVNISQVEAAAACGAAGKRLCTEAEWQMACEANPSNTNVTPYPYGNTYLPNACNGADYDPDCSGGDDDRILPTGTPHGCPAPATSACVSAFGVVDLSGNVREWTSTQVTSDPQTFRIRGGSAANIASGLTCQFDFGLARPAFAFENLGFRCCKDP